MVRTEAYIIPASLKGARERRFSDLQSAAEGLRYPAAKLDAWESGTQRPTLNQARDLAHRLRVPFGYLYLNDLPAESLPLPDLRTVAGASLRRPSPDSLEVIFDAQRKQAWYREQLLQDGTPPLPYVGRFDKSNNPQEIATDIIETIGIDDRLRREAGSWAEFLTGLVRRTEDAGVLVLRSGVAENDNRRILNVDEFRGFVLVDDRAPLIFINNQDTVSARIFTLAHELAHIWINESGISNTVRPDDEAARAHDTERVCNRAAADTLLPPIQFVRRWNDLPDDSTRLDRMAREFRVSSQVVVRQAYDQGEIDLGEYRELMGTVLRLRPPQAKGEGGDFYNNIYARNGRTFSNAVIAAYAEESIDLIEAANLLNVKGKTVHKLMDRGAIDT